jgi:hypothetical protein
MLAPFALLVLILAALFLAKLSGDFTIKTSLFCMLMIIAGIAIGVLIGSGIFSITEYLDSVF